MKWYSIKEFLPSYDGKYIIRYIDNRNYIDIKYVIYSGKEWLDYDEPDHLFKGNITHFSIPEPIEINLLNKL
jgi:hypothetical protein